MRLTVQRLLIIAPLALSLAALPRSGHAQQYPEVQVSTAAFGDIEFDWARDGTYCASCNSGQGNSRFNWVDRSGNLWLGHVDWNTGAFVPANGQAELVDTNAAYWTDFNNGPEWAFSQQGSRLVYTRYQPGKPRTPSYAGAGLAAMVNGTWQSGFLPNGLGMINPIPSQWLPDTYAYVSFWPVAPSGTPQSTIKKMYFEAAVFGGTALHQAPFPCFDDAVRYTAGQHQLTCVGRAADATGTYYQQIFWLSLTSGQWRQLTFDPSTKTDAFMFQAPELNNTWVFFTVTNSRAIALYEQTGVDASGAPVFQLAHQFTSPRADEPYILSPEPFINCSPTCQTYIFYEISASSNAQDPTASDDLVVTNLDWTNPVVKQLTDATSPVRKRSDPEYFITANGPYLYYERLIPATATSPAQVEGEYYIDMQLGPPTGPGGTAE